MTIEAKRLRSPRPPFPRKKPTRAVDDDNNRTFSHLELKADNDNRIGEARASRGLRKSGAAGPCRLGFGVGLCGPPYKRRPAVTAQPAQQVSALFAFYVI